MIIRSMPVIVHREVGRNELAKSLGGTNTRVGEHYLNYFEYVKKLVFRTDNHLRHLPGAETDWRSVANPPMFLSLIHI